MGLTPGMARLAGAAGTAAPRGRTRHRPVPAGRGTDRHPGRRPGRPRHRTAPHRAVVARRHPEPARRRHRPARRGPPRGGPRSGRRRRPSSNGPRAPPSRPWPNCARSSASILPPVLADRGLADALTGLAAGCPVPCRIDVDVPERCAASVEATAYFVVAEALTNIAKHSGAEQATVTVRRRGDRLRLRITDDGRGGADEDGGSGLVGIRRRIEAHDGTLDLASPPGGPTTLKVEPAMRIVIAEDDPLLREGLALLLRAESLDVVATAGTADDFLDAIDDPQARRRHRRRTDAADAHRRGDRRGRRGPAPPARPGRARAVRVRRAGLRHRTARRRRRPARLPAQGTGRPGRGVPGRAAPGGGRRHGHRPRGRRAALHPHPPRHPAGPAQPPRARRARR